MPDVEQFVDFAFPHLGLDLTTEYELQRPDTSILAVNVRVFETLTGRGRGGSRPGLSKFIAVDLSDPQPCQHLAVIVIKQSSTVDEAGVVGYAGLNADRPAGLGGWTVDPETDPSTNNLVDGAGRNRNMLVVGASLVPRVLRTGGSGRPQYRQIGTPGECIQRTYTPIAEGTPYPFILTTDMLPLNFVSIMEAAGIGWTTNPSIWYAAGPQVPSEAEIEAMALADPGWVSAANPTISIEDAACPE